MFTFYDRRLYDNQLMILIRFSIIVPRPRHRKLHYRNHIVDNFPFCLPFSSYQSSMNCICFMLQHINAICFPISAKLFVESLNLFLRLLIALSSNSTVASQLVKLSANENSSRSFNQCCSTCHKQCNKILW